MSTSPTQLPATLTNETTKARPERLLALDVVRGLVIVLMALDHARDFFGSWGWGPTNPAVATPGLFATRWITHLCAPTFVFLAGLGAALSVLRGQSRWAGSAFLISRGFWLILLELTLVKFGWSLNWNYDFVMLQVIWAIGWSMIALGLLLWLPMPVIGLIGLAIVGGHNLTDGLASAKVLPSAPWLWDLLHNQTGMLVNRIPWVADLVPNANRRFVFNLYPVLPWFGVMLTGYGAGLIYRLDPARRRRVLILLGFTLLVGFFALRWPNLYGEPLKWRVFDDPVRSVMSFLNCTKYPPSLQFLLMTLGPALILLGVCEWTRGLGAQFWAVYGRVPLFFYLIHLPLLHAGAKLIANWPAIEKVTERGAASPNWQLAGVYAAWAGAVLLLFAPCWLFGRLKRRYGGPLRYL